MKLYNYSFGLIFIVHIAMTIAFALTVPFFVDGAPLWAYGNWNALSDQSHWRQMVGLFFMFGAPVSYVATMVLHGVMSIPYRALTLAFGK